MSNSLNRLILASALLCTPGSVLAGGAAYVEKFGTDASTCSRLQPCGSIQAGIDAVGVGGRVLVGPGTYEEQLTIPYDRLRLISTHGSTTTIINGREPLVESSVLGEGPAAISINADAVIIGQKKRGFTILSPSGYGVLGQGNRIRVEDNRIEGPANGGTGFGVALVGDQHVVRANRVIGADIGIMLSGVPELGNGRNWLVDGNTIDNPSVGIEALSYAANHRLRNLNNEVDGVGWGFAVYNIDLSDGTSQTQQRPTNEQHTNFRVRRLLSAGVGAAYVEGGNPRLTQIEIHSLFFPADAVELSRTRGARINKLVAVNEVAEFGGSGILLHEAENTTITNSSVVGFQYSVSVVRSSGVQARGNNFTSPAFCAFDVSGDPATTTNLLFARNFWVSPDGPDLSCSPEAQALVDSGELSFSPVDRLN